MPQTFPCTRSMSGSVRPDRSPWLLTTYRVRTGFDGEALDRLWSRRRGQYAVAAIRDASLLRYRYCSHPTATYTHLSVWKSEEPWA